jgi:hypothetical protein
MTSAREGAESLPNRVGSDIVRLLGFQFPALKLYEEQALELRVVNDDADPKGFKEASKDNNTAPKKDEKASGTVAWNRYDKLGQASILIAKISLGKVNDYGLSAWTEIVEDATTKKIPLPSSLKTRLPAVENAKEARDAAARAATALNTAESEPTRISKKDLGTWKEKQTKMALERAQQQKQADDRAQIALSSIDITEKAGDVLLSTAWKAVDKGIGNLQCRGYMIARLNYADPGEGIDAYEYLIACATNVVKDEAGFRAHIGKSGGQVHVEEILASALGTLLSALTDYQDTALAWKGETFAEKRPHGQKRPSKDETETKKEPAQSPAKFDLKKLRVRATIRFVGKQTGVCDACSGTIRQVTEKHAPNVKFLEIHAAKQG